MQISQLVRHLYASICSEARRLRINDRGVSAILTALITPVMVGFLGLGVDVGMWYTKKRELQSAVDSAAVSAALTFAASHNAASARLLAEGDAVRNGFNSATGVASVNIPPATGPNVASTDAAEVILVEPQTLFFSSLFVSAPVNIRTRAVASARVLPGNHCIVALDPSMAGAVEFSGTAVGTIGCGIASNSVSNSSVLIAGSATLTAEPVDSAGDILVGGSATLNTETPPRLGGTVPDPYENLVVPTAPAACRFNNFSSRANNSTLTPGRYCNGLSLTNAANTTFAPGVYIIDRGEFRTTGNSSMHGTGVTFILTGSGTSYANVNFAGGTDVQFTAPTSGTYAGILFYQDRHAPSFRGASLITNSIRGGSHADLVGAIYFPSQEVRFTGGADVGANSCLQLVARKVTITGNANIGIGSDCAGTGVNPINRVVVKLVE